MKNLLKQEIEIETGNRIAQMPFFKKEVGGFVEVNKLVNVIQKDLVPQANKKKCAKSPTIWGYKNLFQLIQIIHQHLYLLLESSKKCL